MVVAINALVIVSICSISYFVPTQSTNTITKITGFVQSEVEYVHDKVKEAVHKVHELLQHKKHESSEHDYNTKGGSSYSKPDVVKDESLAVENINPNVTYQIDVRNNEGGITGNSSRNVEIKSRKQSIFSYKGCPDGQREDRTGRCREISDYI